MKNGTQVQLQWLLDLTSQLQMQIGMANQGIRGLNGQLEGSRLEMITLKRELDSVKESNVSLRGQLTSSVNEILALKARIGDLENFVKANLAGKLVEAFALLGSTNNDA